MSMGTMRTWRARSVVICFGAVLTLGLTASAGKAEYRGGPIKIGVLNDQSGLYADIAGSASVWIARKAVEDFDAAAKGMKVEILSGDHQNKPDIGLSIARQWFDVDKVDAIADVPTSSVSPRSISRRKAACQAIPSSGSTRPCSTICAPSRPR